MLLVNIFGFYCRYMYSLNTLVGLAKYYIFHSQCIYTQTELGSSRVRRLHALLQEKTDEELLYTVALNTDGAEIT